MNTRPRNLPILLTVLLIGIALGTVAGMRLAASASAAQPAAATARVEFAVDGKPIHPAVIQALMTPIEAAAPFVRAVDVLSFAEVDTYELTSQRGVTTAHRLDIKRSRTGDCIAYIHVGVLPGGVHVLDVSECTGGSGIFRSLLFVRLDDVAQSSVLGDRSGVLMMSSVDQISLGDRNDARVSVEGDGVLIQGRLEGELAALGAGKDWVVLKVR